MESEIVGTFSDHFHDYNLTDYGSNAPEDDLLSIFESLEGVLEFPLIDEEVVKVSLKELTEETTRKTLMSQKSTSSSGLQESSETDELIETSRKGKRLKLAFSEETNTANGLQKMSHISVERNRRKQMNENLSVLRSLMPCFYVKKGDQASIIGGVVDYIKELQQVLQSMEAKKQRKIYSEVLSPRIASSPRTISTSISPRKPPLSPILNLPISPRTPQSTSPYKPRLYQQAAAGYLSPTMVNSPSSSTTNTTTTSSFDNVNELVASFKSAIAEVEVKYTGPSNVVLKTVSPPIPGQALKIVSALEDLSLEILQVNICNSDGTMIISFTIKIEIECQLSAQELAHQIQQTFC